MVWLRKLSPFAVLAVALVTFTVVLAAYTGPIRPRTVSVQDGYVRRIYRNSPWQQVCECRYSGDINARCADNDYNCHCSEYPSYSYTCYQSEYYRNETHNPATVSGNFTCGTWGTGGWCRGSPSVNISASEPVSGYRITWIEGSYGAGYFTVCDPVDAATVNCSWTPPNGIFEGSSRLDFWANTTYGDQSAAQNLSFRVDTVPPSVSLTPSGTLGGGGWYRSNVTVTGSGSDSVSGLAGVSLSCGSNPCTISAEGSTTITATATDNAGNSASTNLTVRKDTTPPGITFSPSGTAGSGGWYRSSVTLSASGSDAHSGLSSLTLSCGSNPCTISAQGSTTVTANASDVAGNTASNSTTIYIDSVSPNASLSPSGTLGLNGWYVSNVTVTTSGTDATSGVSSVQTRLNGETWGGNSVTINTDGTHTVEGRAHDVAGNVSSTVSTTIRRDTVPPTASLNVPAPNGANGWFVTNPTVSASGSDATSGLATSQVRVNGGTWQSSAVVSGDGTHTVEGRAQDNAGQWSSTVSTTVRVDTTPPGVSASFPAPNGQNGWYVSPVTVTAQGEDATSGIASREVRLGSGAWQANSLTVNTDGNHTVTVRTTDNAGLSSTTTVNIPYDVTAPAASLNLPAPDGANGWYISPVSVSTNGSDATSGIANTSVRVNGGAWQSTASISTDGIHTVEGQSRDNAGNYSSVPSATVRIDQTPPIVSPSYPAPDGLNGWHVSNVTISALASDATSGVASRQVTLDGSTWVNNDTTITTDGIYIVTVRSTDNAGLSNTAFATIRRDATPPTITGLDVSGAAGNNGWYRSDVNVAGLATDATSGISLIEVNGQSALSLSDGVHSVTVRAVDEAGNESLQTLTVRVDTTPPDLTPQIDIPSGQNGWHVAAVQVDASADDATSGVESVRVRIDNGAWQSLPVTLTDEGIYTVDLEAEDEAGLIANRTLTISIDRTAPTIDPTIPTPDGNNNWYVSPFEVDYYTTDNLSGVQETQWRVNGGDWQSGTPQLDAEGEVVLDIRSQDTAGNERIRDYTFYLDQSLPTGEIALTGEEGLEQWYRSPVEAVLNGEDAVSGVGDTRILGINTQQNGEFSLQSVTQTIATEGWHTLTGEVEDNAGWVRELSRSFGIDMTLPEGGFDELPELLSGTVTLTGEAKDLLSGLQSLEISFSMGYQWQELTADQDRWSYEWDTTQTNGGEKRIYLRLTDKAGNTYTTSVNVLVSNALPQAAITESWVITESGIVNITPGDLPIRQVCLTIQDPADASRKVEWCGESVDDIPNPVQWDGKFADGTSAGPGQYSVTVIVTDIANRTVSATGTVIIPEPTATPTIPPVIPESGGNTPTVPFIPTATPTMTPTATPTQTPVEVEEEQPSATPPAVSMVLPTPQPTIAFKPPKYEVQAVVEVVRRALWPFLTLLGLAAALGYSALRDERPKAIRKLAERMEKIIQFKQEVK